MNMQINTPTPSLRSNYVAVEGLDIGYVSRHRRHVVAERLAAHAEGGTLTCLIGRNGSGKSTLLRTVARLQPNLGGRVELGGVDTAAFSALQLARTLGVVLTSRPDASNITVGEVVAMGRAPYTGFWGRLSDADHRIVDEAMQSVGISHMSHRRVCSLSDGECQKTMIAKTLAQQTPYILLDEPTAFLDPGNRTMILSCLREICSAGQAVVFSSHDIELSLNYCTGIWALGEDKRLHIADGAAMRALAESIFPKTVR